MGLPTQDGVVVGKSAVSLKKLCLDIGLDVVETRRGDSRAGSPSATKELTELRSHVVALQQANEKVMTEMEAANARRHVDAQEKADATAARQEVVIAELRRSNNQQAEQTLLLQQAQVVQTRLLSGLFTGLATLGIAVQQPPEMLQLQQMAEAADGPGDDMEEEVLGPDDAEAMEAAIAEAQAGAAEADAAAARAA